LDLAKDIKKTRNLDIPVMSKNKGNSSNPFDVLQDDSLITMAHKFGLDIENDSASSSESTNFHITLKIARVKFNITSHATVGSPVNVPGTVKSEFISSVCVAEGMSVGQSPLATPTASSFYSESPKTPPYVYENDMETDSEKLWTKNCGHKRGKHPRKIVYYE
jgi:hypothetical protein